MRRAQELEARLIAQGWRKVLGPRRGVLVLCKQEGRNDIIELPDELGLVAGPVLATATGRALSADAGIGAEQAHDWAESGGQSFAQTHWGNYLAVLHDRHGDVLYLLRDPMGAGPCFVARTGQGAFFFTHVSDYLALTGERKFDRDYLAAFLASPRLVTGRTAIEGIEELPAGARLSFYRDRQRMELFWRPSNPGQPGKALSFDAAAHALKARIEASAAAWAASAKRIVHRLSGGLDSSITLAALAAARERGALLCVNEFPRAAPEGDERVIARQVAHRFGVRLVELAIGPEDVAYARVLEVEPSAKPSLSELSFAGTSFADFAAAEGAELLSSGQGGDQVLHRSRGPEIAADAVRDGLAPKALLHIAMDVARLGRRPVWDVFKAQLVYGLARRRFDPSAELIARQALACAKAEEAARKLWDEHVWIEAARKAAPARGKRMLRIADLQFYHNPSVLTEAAANALVLCAQPVVEFCLSIPPYVMTRGGVDRALARAAFGEVLPDVVLKRSLKGDTTRHFTAVLEHNFPFLRDVLIGGRLAEEGLIDAAKLEAALQRSAIVDGKIASGLMQALAAELWLRRLESWAPAPASATSAAAAVQAADGKSTGAHESAHEQDGANAPD